MKKIIIALCIGFAALMAAPGQHCDNMNGKICPEKVVMQCTGKSDCKCPHCTQKTQMACTGKSDCQCPHCAQMKEMNCCAKKAEMVCTGKSDCECPHCTQAKDAEKSGPHCKNCDK